MYRFKVEKIKEQREMKRLSQRDLAEYLGLNSKYSYLRKEKGYQPFQAIELYMLTKLFDVPCEYFFEHQVAENATR